MVLGLFRKKEQISAKRKQFVKVVPKKNKLQKQYQELKESFELFAKINYKLTLKSCSMARIGNLLSKVLILELFLIEGCFRFRVTNKLAWRSLVT